MTEQRFDIAFSTKEIMREAAGPTTASKTKNEENRTISQRMSEVCIEIPLFWEAGWRHPNDCGCRLGWRPVMQGHHATGWTRAESKTLVGADVMVSTVGKDRSHLVEQV